jgi:hypothetical protein
MSNADVVARGLNGFPDCPECQCYPEGRNDCPKHRECIERLGPGQTHGWPRGYAMPLHLLPPVPTPPPARIICQPCGGDISKTGHTSFLCRFVAWLDRR